MVIIIYIYLIVILSRNLYWHKSIENDHPNRETECLSVGCKQLSQWQKMQTTDYPLLSIILRLTALMDISVSVSQESYKHVIIAVSLSRTAVCNF